MQFWENLKEGNKIELLSMAQSPNKERRIYLSKIQDIIEQNKIEILIPMEKGKMILLPVGTRYEVTFYTDVGIFKAESVIRKRYRSSSLVLLEIELTSRLTRKQRREYYRLNCNLRVKCRVITDAEAALREKIRNNQWENIKEKTRHINRLLNMELEAKWMLGIVLDISGGGLRVRIGDKETIGKHLMFRIELPVDGGKRQLDLECNVVSISEIKELNLIQLRCQFININNLKQEMIIKYIFNEQRRQQAMK